MKTLFKIVVVIALLVGVLLLAKNAIANAVVTNGVNAMTGLTLHMDAIDVGVFKNAIGIQGLRLNNPSGFTDPVMVDMPEIYVEYNLEALLQKRVHLKEVRLTLNEFLVVRNPQGHLNLDALKVVQDSKTHAAPASTPAAPSTQLQVDVLELNIGKVVYKDYSLSGKPIVQEFPVNIHERYEHITNPQAFAALIVSRALMNTTIAKLTNLDLGALQAQVGSQLQHATEMVGSAVDAARQMQTGAARGAANAGKEALGAAGEAAKKMTDALKKAFPFGN